MLTVDETRPTQRAPPSTIEGRTSFGPGMFRHAHCGRNSAHPKGATLHQARPDPPARHRPRRQARHRPRRQAGRQPGAAKEAPPPLAPAPSRPPTAYPTAGPPTPGQYPRRPAQGVEHGHVPRVGEPGPGLVEGHPDRLVDLVVAGRVPAGDGHGPVADPLLLAAAVQVGGGRQLRARCGPRCWLPPGPRGWRPARRSRPGRPCPSAGSSRRSGAGAPGPPPGSPLPTRAATPRPPAARHHLARPGAAAGPAPAVE